MKYFLIIMSCVLLDVIEPVGCSRDAEYVDGSTDVPVEQPVPTPAE